MSDTVGMLWVAGIISITAMVIFSKLFDALETKWSECDCKGDVNWEAKYRVLKKEVRIQNKSLRTHSKIIDALVRSKCTMNFMSSRVCERGTKGCDVRHVSRKPHTEI